MHTLSRGDRIRWQDGLETVVTGVSPSGLYVILQVSYDGESPERRYLRFAWSDDPEVSAALNAAGIPTENLAGNWETVPKRKNLRASETLDDTVQSQRKKVA